MDRKEFLDELHSKEFEEKEKIYSLKRKFEEGLIDEEDLTEEEHENLAKLYRELINRNLNEAKIYNKKIAQLKKENNN